MGRRMRRGRKGPPCVRYDVNRLALTLVLYGKFCILHSASIQKQYVISVLLHFLCCGDTARQDPTRFQESMTATVTQWMKDF